MSDVQLIEQPAMVFDVDRPEIRAANAPARRLWGFDDSVTMPVALDPSMPAVSGLRLRGDDSNARPLVFWTLNGAQSLRCTCRPLPDRGSLLVVFDGASGRDMAPNHAEQAAPPGPGAGLAPPPTGSGPPPVINISTMAHELRTPIGAIIALAEMIEREQFGPLGDPRYRDYARNIGESARLSLGIVATALEHSADDGNSLLLGGFSETSIAALIHKCLRMVRQSAHEAGVTLVELVPPEMPDLITNQPALTQILLNLLTNAIKFTPDGGTISIEAASRENGELVVRVSDTGLGMTGVDANVLVAGNEAPTTAGSSQTATCPPATPKPSRGIGFSLVRRLTAAIEAELEISSARGAGTSITLTFPSAKVIPAIADPIEKHN